MNFGNICQVPTNSYNILKIWLNFRIEAIIPINLFENKSFLLALVAGHNCIAFVLQRERFAQSYLK